MSVIEDNLAIILVCLNYILKRFMALQQLVSLKEGPKQ